MGRRLPYTPRGHIRQALRRLWLRSRERAGALKRDGYACQACGKKQSKAKGHVQLVEVHHLHPGDIEWERMIKYIYRNLLVPPEELVTLCPGCHAQEHEGYGKPNGCE